MNQDQTEAMNKYTKFLPSRIIAIIVIAVILSFGVILALFGSPFYINHSPSAPKGIYVISFEKEPHYQKGDFVIALCPMDFPEIHIYKDYLLLKEVQGLAGDTFDVTDEGLSANGKLYPINHTLPYLPHLKEGHYMISEGQVLLLNSPDYSLDSRYFGTVSGNAIRKKVHLLVSYEQIDEWLLHLLPDEALKLLLGKVPAK